MGMRFVRRQEVLRITGFSDSTLSRQERSGQFPRRRVLSPGTVGWLEDDVTAWVQARIKAIDDGAEVDYERF